jgi:hypothetical protein
MDISAKSKLGMSLQKDTGENTRERREFSPLEAGKIPGEIFGGLEKNIMTGCYISKCSFTLITYHEDINQRLQKHHFDI